MCLITWIQFWLAVLIDAAVDGICLPKLPCANSNTLESEYAEVKILIKRDRLLFKSHLKAFLMKAWICQGFMIGSQKCPSYIRFPKVNSWEQMGCQPASRDLLLVLMWIRCLLITQALFTVCVCKNREEPIMCPTPSHISASLLKQLA